MSGVNKVIIVGRLGQNPELKYTPSGVAVCNMSIATSEKWKDKQGQMQEKTEWHRVIVWSKQAEHCSNYLQKGSQAYVEGRLETRKWTDKEGNEKYTTEIIANTVQFLDAKGDKPVNQSAPQQKVTIDQAVNHFSTSDIPF